MRFNANAVPDVFDAIVLRDVISVIALSDVLNIIVLHDAVSVIAVPDVFHIIDLRNVTSIIAPSDAFNIIGLRDVINVVALRNVFSIIAPSVESINVVAVLFFPRSIRGISARSSVYSSLHILYTAAPLRLSSGPPSTSNKHAKVTTLTVTFLRSVFAGAFHGNFSPCPVQVCIVVAESAAAAAGSEVPPGCLRFLARRNNLSSLVARVVGVGHVLQAALLAGKVPASSCCRPGSGPILVTRAPGAGHVLHTGLPVCNVPSSFSSSSSASSSSCCPASGPILVARALGAGHFFHIGLLADNVMYTNVALWRGTPACICCVARGTDAPRSGGRADGKERGRGTGGGSGREKGRGPCRG